MLAENKNNIILLENAVPGNTSVEILKSVHSILHSTREANTGIQLPNVMLK